MNLTIANIPFLGKLIEKVVADQLQVFSKEIDKLEPFQLWFNLEHGT